MGRTNVHSAMSIFKRSGTSFDEIAYIEYADKLVYIINTFLTQADLDRYAELLRTNILGIWLRKTCSDTFCYSDAALALSVSKVIVSSSMNYKIQTWKEEHSEDAEPEQEELVYILITQGRSGDVLSKVVIEPTLDRAAAHVMCDALNHYSIVFTAAILKKNVVKLKDNSYGFKAVENRRALEMLDKDQKTKCIGFWG
jgi:hypothetical protein